jgi:S1-C subfamily serine protease
LEAAVASHFARGILGLLLLVVAVARGADDGPSKVEIAKLGKTATVLVQVKLGKESAYGSAFCVHSSGLFITNAHVARPEEKTGELVLVLNSGQDSQKILPAKLVRSDKELDLALLRVDGEKDLPCLTLGSDEKLAELAEVVACGYPFGAALATDVREFPAVSINSGSITSLRRKDGKLHRIQLDAALNPGNSGGPVLDRTGNVVGVVVAGVKGSGVNFAIPVSHVAQFVARPELELTPPAINRSNLHKPAVFQAKAISVLPTAKPIDLELILNTDQGPERKLAMEQADGAYRLKAIPLPMPDGPLTLRTVVEFADRKVTGTLTDRTVKVDGKEIPLSDVRRIVRQPKPAVLLSDNRTIEGEVAGLDQIEVQADKETLKLDLTKAVAARFELNTRISTISCTLLARRESKEIGRVTQTIAVDGIDTDGNIELKDWIVHCFPGSNWKDYPLDKMKHTLKDGSLELTNNTGIFKWAGIATKRTFSGDYTITVEVKNPKCVGLRSAVGDSAWATAEDLEGPEWKKIVITRKDGKVSITVDGKPVRVTEVNARGLDRAIFGLYLKSDTSATIRRFEVVGGNE